MSILRGFASAPGGSSAKQENVIEHQSIFLIKRNMGERQMKKWTLILAIAMLLVSVTAAWADNHPTYTEDWDGRGTDSEKCRVPDEDDPRFPLYDDGDGWIHWVYSTKGASTNAELIVNGVSYQPGEPLNANIWHFYTPFSELDDLTATIYLFGGAPGPGGGLVISDYCPGEELALDVRKSATAEFIRTHKWDIDKSVTTENEFFLNGYPKIWLYTDGLGDETATWTVDVTYNGYDDSDFVVFGEIEIENISSSVKKVTSIVDDLGFPGYEDIDLECVDGDNNAFDPNELPKDIASGEVWVCSYEVEVDGAAQGDFGTNAVTVLVDGDDTIYGATADWEFDEPKEEFYKTVNVKDISDLFGEVNLGTVTAPYDAQFTYTKDFAYDDYGQAECGSHTYDNTAIIVETEQFASATLKVNVQCLIFQGETAWAANEDTALELRYNPTDRRNWATYVEYAEKTTTLFAGRTIDVGSVTFSAVVDGEVTITVELTTPWEFEDVLENLKVQDYAAAPSGNPSPGSFDHKQNCDASESLCSIVVPANNYYGVHVEVGQWVPDPNFGP
jgi:hypothetical protein